MLSRRGRATVVGLVVALFGIAWSWQVPAATAAGESGASSRVVGRGNIVTTILGWSSARGAPSDRVAPRCRWTTVTDAQLEFLIAVTAELSLLGRTVEWIEPLRTYSGAEEVPEGDLQVRACDRELVAARFVEATTPPTDVEVLLRRMITRLPAPDPTFSPPGGAVVPIGQPVFVSIGEDGWRPVAGTLTANGITAEVRAHPITMRVISGDPNAAPALCDGPGRPFAPRRGAPPAAQARDPRSCTVTYRMASSGPLHERPGSWLGTVTVLWSAEWRVANGPWRDLGVIPRTRIIDRSTRELTTSIESVRLGHLGRVVPSAPGPER